MNSTAKMIEWSVKKYARTRTDKSIALGLNLPVQRVTRERIRLGIKKRNTKRIEAFKALVKSFSREYSDKQIANTLLVPRRTVQKARQRLGIKKEASACTLAGDFRRKRKQDKLDKAAYDSSEDFDKLEQERIYREYGGGVK